MRVLAPNLSALSALTFQSLFNRFTPTPQYLGCKPQEQLQREREEEQLWKLAKQRLTLQQVRVVAVVLLCCWVGGLVGWLV